eukprot:1016103-Rhodomonas_salina.1
MGRGATTTAGTPDLTAGKCAVFEETSDTVRLRCADGTVVTLQKERSATPRQLLQTMRQRRRRCSQGSVPAYKASQFAEAETSFGIPNKLSPVRRWIRALQGALDAAGVTGEPVQSLRPEVEADRRSFIDDHVRGAERDVGSPPPDHTGLFGQEWLFCASDGGCNGSVPYAAWAPPEGRLDVCLAQLNSLTEADDFF